MYNNDLPKTTIHSGQRLSYAKLLRDRHYRIEIPIIQRDYAQGRPQQEDVRSAFLEALYDYLNVGEPNRDLDFVYGSLTRDEESNYTKFIPLDGQQRLTTLFLLHWYLANLDGVFEENLPLFHDQGRSHFTYETRSSSKEFCNALVKFMMNPRSLNYSSISQMLRDQNWYFLSWENDPTIQSMLLMLDEIHSRFQDTTGFFARLTDSGRPVITFQFLDLNEFKLTDDLYIKMNARGKPLTDFENFKAKFEQLIRNTEFDPTPDYRLQFNEHEKPATVHEYFAHRIDTVWANLFWQYREGDSFDEKIMSFIRALTVNHYGIREVNAKHDEYLKYLLDVENPTVSFQRYQQMGGFNSRFIINFIDLLDALHNGDGLVRTYQLDSSYYDEQRMFELSLDNKLNYEQRLQFHGYTLFLCRFRDKTSKFNEWVRVIHNLTDNVIYNSRPQFMRALRAIEDLVDHADNILEYLLKGHDMPGFNQMQVKEERMKAQLILKSVDWRRAIIMAEKHEYLNGQIGFLLYYSGIEAYYDEQDRIFGWTDTDNTIFLESFLDYLVKVTAVFQPEGLGYFTDYVWRRALLTKGNYLLRESLNFSFLIDKDRDISWKRLFLDGGRADDGALEKRNSVKALFDDPRFQIHDLSDSLSRIINETPHTGDWREDFIRNPKLIEFLGQKKYIRRENGHVFLLKLTRLSGRHGEVTTRLYYLQNYNNWEHIPFQNEVVYQYGVGRDYPPHILFSGYTYKTRTYDLWVTYGDSLDSFKVIFYCPNNRKLNDNLVELLTETGFEEYDDKSFYKETLISNTNLLLTNLFANLTKLD